MWDLTPAGSWGLATTTVPAEMTSALALPGSWPWDSKRCMVRRDQWANLRPPLPPAITGISPTNGAAAGGTAFVLDGRGFTGYTDLTFAGVPATDQTLESDSVIRCTTPPYDGSVGPTPVAAPIVLHHPLGNATGRTFVYA